MFLLQNDLIDLAFHEFFQKVVMLLYFFTQSIKKWSHFTVENSMKSGK